jgi:hypothetical protein
LTKKAHFLGPMEEDLQGVPNQHQGTARDGFLDGGGGRVDGQVEGGDILEEEGDGQVEGRDSIPGATLDIVKESGSF